MCHALIDGHYISGGEEQQASQTGVSDFVEAALNTSARGQLSGASSTLAQGIDSSSSQLRLQARPLQCLHLFAAQTLILSRI